MKTKPLNEIVPAGSSAFGPPRPARCSLYLAGYLLLAGAFLASPRAVAGTATVEQELIKAENDWNDAWIKADMKALDRIVADDIIFVGGDNQVNNKESFLAPIRSGEDKMFSGVLDQFKIHSLGEVVIVSLRWTGKEVYKGVDISGQYRTTDTWAKRAGHWRVVASHNSKLDAETDVANVRAELIKVENEWIDALIKPDFTALERLMVEDYIGTGSDGTPEIGRAKLIEDLKSGNYAAISAVVDDFNFLIYGGTAIVNARWTAKERFNGKEYSGEYRSTDTWFKKDGRWQVAASHSCKIESPATGEALAQTKQALIKLENDWNDALVRVDLKAIDRLYADGVIFTGSDGERASKTKAISDQKSGEDVISAAKSDDFQVNIDGDVAVVSLRWTCKEKFHGNDLSGSYHYTDTWVKRDGRWQVLASHGSKIDDAGNGNAEAKREIADLYRQWDSASVNADLLILDRILGTEYIGVSPQGEVFSKKEVLEDMKSGHDVITSALSEDLKITVFGNGASVVGSYSETGKSNGSDDSGSGPFTDALVKRDGRWQVVADQWVKTMSATGEATEEAKRELIQLENEWNTASIKSDIEALNKITADEYFLLTDDKVYTRAELMEGVRSGDDRVTAATSEDFRIHIYGDTAIVSQLYTSKETYKGEDIGGRFRSTDIFVKRDGRWQAVTSQGSKLEKTPAEKPSSATSPEAAKKN